MQLEVQATLFISKSRGPDKILRDISSSRYPTFDVIHIFHVHVCGTTYRMYMYQPIMQIPTRGIPIRWFAYLCVWKWNKRNVTDSTLCIHSKKMSVINACLARRFLKSICETHLSTSYNFSSTSVTFDCCLHQRTPLNCSVIKVTKAALCIRGF